MNETAFWGCYDHSDEEADEELQKMIEQPEPIILEDEENSDIPVLDKASLPSASDRIVFESGSFETNSHQDEVQIVQPRPTLKKKVSLTSVLDKLKSNGPSKSQEAVQNQDNHYNENNNNNNKETDSFPYNYNNNNNNTSRGSDTEPDTSLLFRTEEDNNHYNYNSNSNNNNRTNNTLISISSRKRRNVQVCFYSFFYSNPRYLFSSNRVQFYRNR